MLFEMEMLFIWDGLLDPHNVKKLLGRNVPFAAAMMEDHKTEITNNWEKWKFSIKQQHGDFVSGIVLIGLTENEFEILDNFYQTPIHHRKDKIKCKIGNLERILNVYLQQGALLE